MAPPRPHSRFARALAREPGAPVAVGLTFGSAEVYLALGGSQDPLAALPAASRGLKLDFAFVPPGAAEAGGELLEAGCEHVGVVDGPLGQALSRLGWTHGLQAATTDPQALRGPLAEGEGEALRAVRIAAAKDAGAIVIAEDLAASEGPLVPPDFAFAEVFPRLRRVVAAAAAHGLPTLLHTDGDARVFLGAAAQAGFAGVHGGGGLGAERGALLVAAVRAAGLAFVGGLPTADLSSGPMRAVAAGSRAGLLARAGGVLIADDGGMTTAAEAYAFVSALEAARDAAEGGRGGG